MQTQLEENCLVKIFTTRDSKINKFLRTVLVLTVYFLIWALLAGMVDEEILIPKPASVFKSLLALSRTVLFWRSILLSIGRILIGFFLALVVGTIFAILTVKSKLVMDLFYPLISSVKATPVASFIILALFWLTTGRVPIFICFLMVLPTVWTNIREGILNVDEDLIEMSRIYNFTPYARFRYIYVPTIIPFFRAAFASGLGMAWKAGVAAEVIGRPDLSIGKELYNAKIYLDMPKMFAWTFVVILISIILEKLLIFLMNHIGRRYGGYEV